MNEEMHHLIESIEESLDRDSFTQVAEEATARLLSLDDPVDAIAPILHLMEVNESVDFGMPGPLVHFVEKFFRNGYEELLLDSVRRHPTPHTLWMVNRIANGVDEAERAIYLKEFDRILADPEMDADVRDLAREFRGLHS